jgi:hypothetical protein
VGRDDQGAEHLPLSTDLAATPATILGLFVSRWRVETTFQEVRAHLGVETQRQWSDLAILRTTPALRGLFSLITVWAEAWHGMRPKRYARTPPPGIASRSRHSATPSPPSGACFGVHRISISRQAGENVKLPLAC